MKERLLDVIKWGLIIIIGGCVFYMVYPKYYFVACTGGFPPLRGNRITGEGAVLSTAGSSWYWKDFAKTK